MHVWKMTTGFRDTFARHPRWFWFSLLSLFMAAAAVRFWGLERFNVLVFDEFFFAKFASDYLTDTAFLDGHPPLGKYFIAVGIWLSRLNPFGYAVQTTVADPSVDLPTISYRWMNALVGSFIPILVTVLAYLLNRSYRFALIAGVFTALDGLLLVESRYALINVYLIAFGLLGQIGLLAALAAPNRATRNRCLIAAGIGFGASMSVKWTGLGFLLGPYLLWGALQIANRVAAAKESAAALTTEQTTAPVTSLPYIKPLRTVPVAATSRMGILINPLLRRFGELHWRDFLFYLGAVPVFAYCLLWLPHIHHDSQHSLLGYQKQMLSWHTSIGGQDHTYCSAWYTWPWMGRSVAYYYSKTEIPATPSSDTSAMIHYYVNGMGNPFLWWQSLVAVMIVASVAIWAIPRLLARTTPSTPVSEAAVVTSPSTGWTHGGTALFIVLSYFSNWLPWSAIGRCSLIYHYMPASLFSFLALAWVVEQGLASRTAWKEAVAGLIILLVLFGFVYWLPFFLGLPLPSEAYTSRIWFESWI